MPSTRRGESSALTQPGSAWPPAGLAPLLGRQLAARAGSGQGEEKGHQGPTLLRRQPPNQWSSQSLSAPGSQRPRVADTPRHPSHKPGTRRSREKPLPTILCHGWGSGWGEGAQTATPFPGTPGGPPSPAHARPSPIAPHEGGHSLSQWDGGDFTLVLPTDTNQPIFGKAAGVPTAPPRPPFAWGCSSPTWEGAAPPATMPHPCHVLLAAHPQQAPRYLGAVQGKRVHGRGCGGRNDLS